jgi:hypothetical protein
MDGVDPSLRGLIYKRSDGAWNGGGANQNVDFAIVDAHAVDGCVHLFEIGNVGADSQRVASGVLDFQMRQVQFSLAAREQRHAISGGREA